MMHRNVGQVVNLRPIVNRPPGGESEPPEPALLFDGWHRDAPLKRRRQTTKNGGLPHVGMSQVQTQVRRPVLQDTGRETCATEP
jgi:hypothetical protein